MFGLLNPALAPLKAKVLLFTAGAVLVMLLGAIATSTFAIKAWQATKVELGQVGQKLADATQLSIDNQAVWDLKTADYERRLKDKDTVRVAMEDAAKKSKEREARYNRQLSAALKHLEEATNANEEARDWAVVTVPAAVIDGMCSAAREAVGEAAGCGSHDDRGHQDPGLDAGALHDQAAT